MSSRHHAYLPYNFPIPEDLLFNRGSHPMTQQFSSGSYGSVSSSSSDNSIAEFFHPTSPGQDEDFNSAFTSQGRHCSQSYYDEPASFISHGINPQILQSTPYSGARHGHMSEQRHVLPSSDIRNLANSEDAQARGHRRGGGGRHESQSPRSEKESSKRVACTWPGCTSTFSRKADVVRHVESMHEVKLIDCDVYRCGRTGKFGFARKDHLLEHKRGYHNMDIEKRNVKSSKNSRHD